MARFTVRSIVKGGRTPTLAIRLPQIVGTPSLTGFGGGSRDPSSCPNRTRDQGCFT
jgi:hypothetical protein